MMMMMTMMHKLLPVPAATCLAIAFSWHATNCNAFSYHPSAASFIINYPTSSSYNNCILTSQKSTGTGRKQVIICPLSLSSQPNEDDDDGDGDGTFFLQASQQAARQRMQQLKDGDSPLAIALSSSTAAAAAAAADVAVGGEVEDDVVSTTAEEKDATEEDEIKVDVDELLQSAEIEIEPVATPSSSSSSTDEKDEPKIVNVEALLQSVDFDTTSTKKEEPVVIKDEPSLPLTEGLTADEAEEIRTARVSGGVRKKAETASTLEGGDTGATLQVTEGQTAKEAEETRKARLDAADEVAKTVKQQSIASESSTRAKDDKVKIPIDPFQQRQKKQTESSGTVNKSLATKDEESTGKDESKTPLSSQPTPTAKVVEQKEEDDDDDDTFFLQASQQAAQQRLQQLKDGQSPPAIALSTADVVVDGEDKAAVSTTAKEEEEVEGDTLKNEITKEVNVEKLLFQSVDIEIIEPDTTTSEDTEKDKSNNVDVDALLQSVEEPVEKMPKSGVVTQPLAETDTATTKLSSADIDDTAAEAEEEGTTSANKLSSDGKKIFEPSKSALEMNQENVDMGLLVLTRAMLTLQSIVDEDE